MAPRPFSQACREQKVWEHPHKKHVQHVLNTSGEEGLWPPGTSPEPCWSLLHPESQWRSACSSGYSPGFPGKGTSAGNDMRTEGRCGVNSEDIRHRHICTRADLLVPGRHDVLHVHVAGEKGHDAVWDDRRHLQEQVAIVTNNSWGKRKTHSQIKPSILSTFSGEKHTHTYISIYIYTYICIYLQTKVFSGLKLWAQGHLVVPSADNLKRNLKTRSDADFLIELSRAPSAFLLPGDAAHQRTEAGPRQRHREGRHGNGAKVKDSGIDVQRWERLRMKNNQLQSDHMWTAVIFYIWRSGCASVDVSGSWPELTPVFVFKQTNKQ